MRNPSGSYSITMTSVFIRTMLLLFYRNDMPILWETGYRDDLRHIIFKIKLNEVSLSF